MQEDKNYNELLHTMKLIIDSITKDSAEQQGSLDFGDENTFIDEGIFREVDGEFVLDMYVLKGLDYSKLDTMMLLMPNNYTEVDIHEEDEEYFGLDVDGAIGKVLDAYPSIEEFQVRYFKLPDYAYLSEEVGGINTGLFIPLDEQEEGVISNYVDREYLEQLGEYQIEDYEDFTEEYIMGLDEETTIDIYLIDGADFDKVEEDNLDLEDSDNYITVHMTDELLQTIGIDEDEMLSQIGIDKGDSTVNYKLLPKEYYLTPEQGGIPYPHIQQETLPTDITEKETEVSRKVEEDVIEEEVMEEDVMEEDVMEEYRMWVKEVEQEVRQELRMDLKQVNTKIKALLEKERATQDDGRLNKLNIKYLDNYFTKYSQKRNKVRGYYVTTEDILGILTKTVHIIVDSEGEDEVWVFSYTGVYRAKGKDIVYDFMEKHHKGSNEFNLDRVVTVPKDELNMLMDEDFGY